MSIAHLEYPCLTEGGLETTLVFDGGFDLPHVAAFTLLESDGGRAALASYYDAHLAVAEAHDLPIVLDTPTWRASADWGRLLGSSEEQLAEANRDAVEAVREAIGRRSARAFVCGRMRRGRATLSSTRRPSWIAATPASSRTTFSLSARRCRGSRSSAGAAGRMRGTSPRSPWCSLRLEHRQGIPVRILEPR